jgi:hypothetical protein
MSNGSSSPQQIISLPKGGDALHGTGEMFSLNLHTGTGNFTVPITLPPGRNGLQPQLSLVYSTGNGNCSFGLGWSLGIPRISRKTSRGVPLYDNVQDTFLISDAEDLVRVEGETSESASEVKTRSRYRPRTEGLFAKIDHLRIVNKELPTNCSDFWEVRSKDGLVSLFGEPRSAGTGEHWPNATTLVDSNTPGHIFAWKLIRTTDPIWESY